MKITQSHVYRAIDVKIPKRKLIFWPIASCSSFELKSKSLQCMAKTILLPLSFQYFQRELYVWKDLYMDEYTNTHHLNWAFIFTPSSFPIGIFLPSFKLRPDNSIILQILKSDSNFEPYKSLQLTDNYWSRYMSFSIVWQKHQLGDEDGVIEPDEQHRAEAEPAHGVHHEVQPQLHPSS